MWSALLAWLVACGVPLLFGLVLFGWSTQRTAAYVALAVAYVVVLIAPVRGANSRWVAYLPVWGFLLLLGGIGFGLLLVSGDTNVQPIVFMIPLVFAVQAYAPLWALMVAAGYLVLLALALLLRGVSFGWALLWPLGGHAALMGFIFAFARLNVAQTVARSRADQLAGALARQRDYLQRLAEVTASLTRDLDLIVVLEQVAAEGQALAQARAVRVWLQEDEGLTLAAVVPRSPLAPSGRGHVPQPASLKLSLVAKGSEIGMLELVPADGVPLRVDQSLLQPFADAAAIAILNARLYEQARLLATMAERNRIARDLHDTIAQGLTAVSMHLEAAQRSWERDPTRSRSRLTRAQELARETLADVRRSVWDLASPLVPGTALPHLLAEQSERWGERTHVAIRYSHAGPAPAFDSATAMQVVRIVQEALTNIEKHAAASEVSVQSKAEADMFEVRIDDNGVGFSLELAEQASGFGGTGFGLRSIRERARLAKGQVEFTSTQGLGTSVRIAIPIPPATD